MDVIFVCSLRKDRHKERKREIERVIRNFCNASQNDKESIYSNDLTKVGQSFNFLFSISFLLLGLDVGHSRKSHYTSAWECSECVANCEEIEFIWFFSHNRTEIRVYRHNQRLITHFKWDVSTWDVSSIDHNWISSFTTAMAEKAWIKCKRYMCDRQI